MYSITFQQIQAFLTVAKSLNLSKAGEILYTSQPALSKTLKRFEEGVEMRLFNRSNQGMTLTESGEYLQSTLEPLYKSFVQSIQYAQRNSVTPYKVLRIIEPSSYLCVEEFALFRDAVNRYAAKYPDVKIEEVLCDFKDLRQTLDFGSVDIAFTEDFCIRDMQNITVRNIDRMNMYIAFSAGHPLAQGDKLDYKALNNLTLFTVPTIIEEQQDATALYAVCQEIGFKPKTIEFMPNFLSLIHALELGKGISICSRFRNLGPVNSLKFYPIHMEQPPYTCVAWRTGRLTREARNFLEMLPGSGAELSYVGKQEAGDE